MTHIVERARALARALTAGAHRVKRLAARWGTPGQRNA